MKNIRSRHRLEVQKKRENKNYNDYDWLQLFISGTLEKLNVKELDKYLDKHKLPKYRKLKGEKVDIISTHILGTPEFRSRKVTANELQTTTTDISDTNSSDSESENAIIGVIDSDDCFSDNSETSSTADISDSDCDETSPTQFHGKVTLRSGRVAGQFLFH